MLELNRASSLSLTTLSPCHGYKNTYVLFSLASRSHTNTHTHIQSDKKYRESVKERRRESENVYERE